MKPRLAAFRDVARPLINATSSLLLALDDAPGDPVLIDTLAARIDEIGHHAHDLPAILDMLAAAQAIVHAAQHGRLLLTRATVSQLLAASAFLGELCGHDAPGQSHLTAAKTLAATLRAHLPGSQGPGDTAFPAPAGPRVGALTIRIATSADQRIAIPAGSLVATLRASPDAITDTGGCRSLRQGDRSWVLHDLGRLLAIPEWPRSGPDGRLLVLILATGSGEQALVVDALDEPVPIDPANNLSGWPPAYVTLPDGTVLPVLNRELLA